MTIAVNRNLSNCKTLFGLFHNCLNCDSLRWSHIYFICIHAVHLISFCVSFFSRVDELNKLACPQWVFIAQLGEHCSANAEAMGSNPIEAPKNIFWGPISQLLVNKLLEFTAMAQNIFISFDCIPAVHVILF